MKNVFKNLGIYTGSLYVIAASYFMYQLLRLQILKTGYVVAVILGAVIVAIALFAMLFVKKAKRAVKITGNSLAVLFVVIFFLGGFGFYVTNSLIQNITEQSVENKDISLIVLKENEIKTVKDIQDKHALGYQTRCYPEGVDKMLNSLKDERGSENPTKKFDSINEMVKGLYDKKVPIIIFDEAYRHVLEEEYPTFAKDTRVVYTINYPEKEKSFAKEVDISEDSFVVLISGIDTYGGIKKVSRSDVNILAVVNPKKAKILLISIPRDYYVPIVSGGSSIGRTDGQYDKLTHTGLFGPRCTVSTLEEVFDIPIHYYVRVNFTSVVDIVNAIGGITVQSDYAFDGFVVGENACNGERALKFSRERYAFVDGDRQRGKNQMEVIKAIVNKLSNPTLEYDYFQLFQTLSNCVETNISDKDVKKLIQFQINNMPAWSVETTSVDGSDGKDYSYYSGQNLYVMYPNQESIDAAIEKIRSVYFD